MKKIIVQKIGLMVSSLAILISGTIVQAATYASINQNVSMGSTGNEVRNLQTFLASNHDIYPEGIISGYYGSLTRNAVAQLQLYYHLPIVGNVGPLTRARINTLIAMGYGIDIYSPFISNVSIQKTNTTASISWNTNELARGKVYYSTSPFFLAESSSNSEPTVTGGTNVAVTNMQSTQSVNLSGLIPNTQYYYLITATDASLNVGATVQSTFSTNP